MALNNIKNLRQENGFTIVELLIVIVVIAILATISIVSYTGIQNRANTSAAQASANGAQKTAEAFYADQQAYPRTSAEFKTSTNAAKLPSNVTFITGATVNSAATYATATASPTSQRKDRVWYQFTPATGTAVGARIQYWDFSTNTISTNVILMGNTNSPTWTNPAS